MMKNSVHEFPSDIFSAFECVGAVLRISDGVKIRNISPKQLVKFDVSKKSSQK